MEGGGEFSKVRVLEKIPEREREKEKGEENLTKRDRLG